MEEDDGGSAGSAALQPPSPYLVTPASAPLSPQLLDLEASIVSDPILDLCPSLDLLKTLARASKVTPEIKREKLARALLRSASNGDTDILSWLLDPRNEARGLMASADGAIDANGRKKIVFDEIRDEDGTGPVVLAACAGHVDCVTMLVMNGADVDERDACGWTPLMWATNSSNLTLAAYLLEHGADVEARSSKGTSCEDFILSAAPDAASVEQRTSSSGGGEAEREQLADLIYEHQRFAAMQASSTQKLRDLSFSSPGKTGSVGNPGSPRKSAALLPSMDFGSSWSGSGQPSHSRASSHTTFKVGHSRTNSQMTASRRLVGRVERAHIADQELRAREVAEGRKRALLDIAVMLELDYAALVGDPTPGTAEAAAAANTSRATRRRGAPKVAPPALATGCGALEVGSDILSVEFSWSKVRSDQMLVFGLNDLTPLLDRMITDIKPLRAPWTSRAAPANVLFLCARYACSLGDEELLEELFLGAIDRIEGSIYAHPTDMTCLAFWLYNCCLLHYYTQKDATLRASEAVGEYRALLADLLNEIYVFVIRDAERRIDKALDQAILDHEAIEGFEEVRFEGEWKFMRTLAGSVKGIGQQGSISASASSNSLANSARRPISQIFGRREQNGSDPSQQQQPPTISPNPGVGSPGAKSGSLGRSDSTYRFPADGASPSRRQPPGEALPTMREVSCDVTAADLLSKPSPRTITSLLTSTLHVLQLYEINPAIIIQGLSQIFFWVGCELFNRTLSRKRYLCRSRAMQIRLNVSALEDWARSNALPLSIVHAHLSPLSQLVSWLQCQSSLNDFDGLIATMQGLKALNPLQMRKAVKDYRYEVGESRMSEECVQYLDQLIIDWKRRQEDQARQQAIEDRAIQKRRKEAAKRGSVGLEDENFPQISHHRSGTATQNGYTPDSRSPSPSSMGEAGAYSEEPEDADTSADRDGLGNRSGDSVLELSADASMSTIATAGATPSGPLTVAEATARSAQQAIDSLFSPGKSMSDYIPPWTAAGAPLGVNGSRPHSVTASDGLVAEMLNSRDMLPFALPSRPEAMIVTPGDAFGFGRGHFTGTGTPSLRSVAGSEAGSVSSSRRSSIASSSSLRGSGFDGKASRPVTPDEPMGPGDAEGDVTVGGDGESVASGLTGTSNASRSSSLFPQGKGFAAGGSWCPVPVLEEKLLDEINDIMRHVALTSGGDRRGSSAAVALGSEMEPSASPIKAKAPLPPAVFKIPPRMSSSSTASSPTPSMFSPQPDVVGHHGGAGVARAGSPLKQVHASVFPPQHSTEASTLSLLQESHVDADDSAGAERRRQSGLSVKPSPLVIPPRSAGSRNGGLELSFTEEYEEDLEAEPREQGWGKTPTATTRPAGPLQ